MGHRSRAGPIGNERSPDLDGRRQPSNGGTSRMMREYQVRICEGLGVKYPGPTRQVRRDRHATAISALPPEPDIPPMLPPPAAEARDIPAASIQSKAIPIPVHPGKAETEVRSRPHRSGKLARAADNEDRGQRRVQASARSERCCRRLLLTEVKYYGGPVCLSQGSTHCGWS